MKRRGSGSVLEKEIHIRLWEIFKNVIFKEQFEFEGTSFVDIKFEPVINGKPDLVIEAIEKAKGKKIPILVIEAKRKVPYPDRRFDPYSIEVINQAVRYANQLGAPYFATCNGEIMVVFNTFTLGVPLIQRRLKQYKVSYEEEFAKTVLRELVRFKLGVGKWLPLDDIFVERLRSFHNFITPFMHDALTKKLKEDEGFKKQYINWLRSQMFEYSDETNETIAEQLSYLLMNKVTFYKTLESQITDVDIDKLDKIEAKDGVVFSGKLQEKFQKLTKKADYEGIFQPTILDSVNVPDELVYYLNEFIEELGAYNLGKIRADVIGRVYEDLIPPDERHRLGQYYTPPPIVDLIVELCIKSPNDRILDPACGSGSFLVKAYHKLRDLKKKENPFIKDEDLHIGLLEQIYGVDINPFPTQLSSMNLAVRNLKVRSKHINLFPMDFFRVKPDMVFLPKEFDVIVTNPPYTRQEELEYKDRIRKEALTYSDGSKVDIGAQAGIYAYFFTHSAKFLRNTGRMGYITSNSWLDVSFGKGLKQFFLDHFKILAIIEHDAGVFEKAVVDTCVVILEKSEGETLQREREKNTVKFIRLKRRMDIAELVELIEHTTTDYEDERIRLVIKKQSELPVEEKWGKYLRSPQVYYKIIKSPIITELGNVADVRRGYTTGVEDFFYLKEDDIKLWKIEKSYLKSVVTNPRNITSIKLSNADLEEYLLVVNEQKDALQDKNVIKYIELGESRDYHLRQTTKTRKLWYSLPKRKPFPIIVHRFIRQRMIVAWNDIKACVDDSFYEVAPENEEDIPIMLGYLNSSLLELIMELHGRLYGAGLLEIKVYEMKRLPIINMSKLGKKERHLIKDAFEKYCDAQQTGNQKNIDKARMELDDAVFNVLKLNEKERKQVYEGLEALRSMRLQRKEVDVLVETAEKWKPRKKTKRRKIAEEMPSKRLDTWIND